MVVVIVFVDVRVLVNIVDACLFFFIFFFFFNSPIVASDLCRAQFVVHPSLVATSFWRLVKLIDERRIKHHGSPRPAARTDQVHKRSEFVIIIMSGLRYAIIASDENIALDTA